MKNNRNETSGGGRGSKGLHTALLEFSLFLGIGEESGLGLLAELLHVDKLRRGESE